MKTMNIPGFTADVSLYRTSGSYQSRSNVDGSEKQEVAAKVVPQLAIDLGCKAFDVCHTQCCTLHIDYVGPYHFPQVTNNCTTEYTCAGGGIFR
jgi:hypothetical protein